jgi:hypothetical protein
MAAGGGGAEPLVAQGRPFHEAVALLGRGGGALLGRGRRRPHDRDLDPGRSLPHRRAYRTGVAPARRPPAFQAESRGAVSAGLTLDRRPRPSVSSADVSSGPPRHRRRALCAARLQVSRAGSGRAPSLRGSRWPPRVDRRAARRPRGAAWPRLSAGRGRLRPATSAGYCPGPDVSFVSNSRLPPERLPEHFIPAHPTWRSKFCSRATAGPMWRRRSQTTSARARGSSGWWIPGRPRDRSLSRPSASDRSARKHPRRRGRGARVRARSAGAVHASIPVRRAAPRICSTRLSSGPAPSCSNTAAAAERLSSASDPSPSSPHARPTSTRVRAAS